jgi:hypothetical protein
MQSKEWGGRGEGRWRERNLAEKFRENFQEEVILKLRLESRI